jgi:branched-chain amino acid transport system substrate-binding protein
MKRPSRAAGLAVLGVWAMVAASCGDDDTRATDDAAASTEVAAAESNAATVPAATNEVATASTGGESEASEADAAPDRSGETILIGLVNEDEGVYAFPEFRIGAEVAFQAINDAGGINGAMIELVSCSTDLSPESSIDCANQMVEAEVAVAFTAIDLASDAALPIYQEAGIPYVTSNNWGDAQDSAEGSHLLHVASEGLSVGAFALAQELGITDVAFVYEKSPATENIVSNIHPPLAEAFGLNLTSAGVDGAAPDWTAAVATAQAAGVDLIYGLISEPSCTAMVQAARDAGFEGSIVAGACSQFMPVLGEDSVGVYTVLDQLQPSTKASAPPEIAANLTEYEGLMADAGHEKYTEGYAVWAYGAARELGTILSSIEGEITSESAKAALSRDVIVPGELGPDLNCGSAPWPSSPAHCSSTISVYQTEQADDGTLVRAVALPFFDAYALFQEQ